MRSSEPIFNVPAIVVVIVGVLAAIHVGRETLLSPHDVLWLIYAFGFIPARYTELGPELPGWPWAAVASPITHQLLHGDYVHLGVNSVWLLAVGSPLAKRMGSLHFVLFGLACGVAGALMFLVVNPGLDIPVVGASGAISGLMGAMFRLMFAVVSAEDRGLLRDRPDLSPKLDLAGFFTDRRALIAALAFVGINALIALGVPGLGAPGAGGIAWEAHVGGFLAGLLAFDWFDAKRPLRQHPWID